MKPFIPQELPLKEVTWEPLIRHIGDARAAIANYDGVLCGIPNTSVLLTPLTTREALLSSKIEGTIATMGEVYRFEAGEMPEQGARRDEMMEIINYRKALRYAEQKLKSKPFHLNMLLEIHSILLNSVRGKDKSPGQFRRTQNYIGQPRSHIEKAEFVPPEPHLVMKYMDNWEKYYHMERPDPLVQLAIVHAQFEIIHPFNDGNGRIGRILIPIFLHEKKLINSPMFYLSEYLDEHRDEYISRLRSLGRDHEAWNRWIEFFLLAIKAQAVKNASKVREMLALYDEMKNRVIELTHSQYAIPLLDKMFGQPIFHGTHIKFTGKYKPRRQTVAGLLRALREAGILKVLQEGSGRRPQILAFTDLINLCEGKNVL